MKKRLGRLTLCKETVRNLTADSLKEAAGGIPPTIREVTCVSCQDTCANSCYGSCSACSNCYYC